MWELPRRQRVPLRERRVRRRVQAQTRSRGLSNRRSARAVVHDVGLLPSGQDSLVPVPVQGLFSRREVPVRCRRARPVSQPANPKDLGFQEWS